MPESGITRNAPGTVPEALSEHDVPPEART